MQSLRAHSRLVLFQLQEVKAEVLRLYLMLVAVKLEYDGAQGSLNIGRINAAAG